MIIYVKKERRIFFGAVIPNLRSLTNAIPDTDTYFITTQKIQGLLTRYHVRLMVPKVAARLGDIHQTYITFWKHRHYPFSRMRLRLNGYHVHLRTETGLEAIERLHFLASFPLPGTGKREGGEKTQPFNRFASHPVTPFAIALGVKVL